MNPGVQPCESSIADTTRISASIHLGNLYIIAVIDDANDVAECVETNNISVFGPLP